MGAPFIFKIKFYGPSDGAKNSAHALYIGTRPGADRGEVEIGDRDSDFSEKDTAAGHVKYAATRPRSHGLFGPDEDKTPDLEAVQNELRHHKGIVWRAVLSLREDDAVRMGYIERKSWEDALRASVSEAAGKMGISESNLRWTAAFHAESGHPHSHLMFWEAEPKRTRGVLSMGERKDVRKAFVRQIYAAERTRILAEKTALRDLIRDLGKKDIRELLSDVKSAGEYVRSLDGAAAGVPPRLHDEVRAALGEKLEQIADILPGKGRVALKYMPPEVKEKIRETADWMIKQPGFSESVKRYVEIAKDLAGQYTSGDSVLEESGRKAYEDLRDRVSQEILKGAVELGKVERDGASFNDGIPFEGDVEPFASERGRMSFPRVSIATSKPSGSAGGVSISKGDVNKLTDDLWKDAWRSAERVVYRLDPFEREKMPAIEIDFKARVVERLEVIAGLIPEDSLKGRLALAYLPQKVKDEARDVAGQLLQSGKLGALKDKYVELIKGGQSEEAAREAYHWLRERVAEQVVTRAAELLPREIPQVKMLAHQGRVTEAFERLKSSTADYIRGDKEEAEWTAGTMYRSLTRLGVDSLKAKEIVASWGREAGLTDFEKVVFDKGEGGSKPVHVSRRDWTRLRENLGLEEEELLHPWFGTLVQNQQEKEKQEPGEFRQDEQETIPHELVERRIAPAIQALESAADKPDNYAEVQWTIRTFTSTLQALGVGEEERALIVRSWVERAGVEISEARFRDVLDRITVLPKEDFWLGRASWIRLTSNLNITKPAAAPWRVISDREFMGADKDKQTEDLWRDAWRTTERAVYRLVPGGREKMPAIDSSMKEQVAERLEDLARTIPEDALKGRLALAYLPQEVNDEARAIADHLLQSGKLALLQGKYVETVRASQGEEVAGEAYHWLRERVAEQVVTRAAELLPREIPQVKMLAHQGRLVEAVERFKSATADYIRGDAEEAEWTAGAMYRAMVRLGVDDQSAREVTEKWAESAGLKEAARIVTREAVKMECIAEEYREENKPEPVHVSRRDWTRLRENLGLEEEELLHPWFGIQPKIDEEQSQEPVQPGQEEKEVIPHELVDSRIASAVRALETASGKPENYTEVQWTIRTLTSTLQALGIEEGERARIVRGWVERSGLEISKARLRDVLDRVAVLPREDFWLGRASWKRLTENLGIHNPPASPWRVLVDRSGNVAGQVWKAVWRAVERERTKLEAQRLTFKRMDDMRRKRVKEREEKRSGSR